jgi:hypothetical protein
MIADMTNVDNFKYLEDKKKKNSFLTQKIKSRQDNEMKAFICKTEASYGEFKKNRAIGFDQ